MSLSRRAVIGILLASALRLAACGSTAGEGGIYQQPGEGAAGPEEEALPEEAAEGGAAQVKTAGSSLGEILVDGEGMTLYAFLNDSPGQSNCTGGCAQAWPPLLTQGEPQAGEGVEAALLGTFERQDGSSQVTYNDMPLYYFAGDSDPGDTNGQGSGEVWYVVSPAGEILQQSAEPAGSSSGSGGYGRDYDY